MNVIKEIERITALELEAGIIGGLTNGSWHEKYKNSAWVYVGGMSYELSEGDIICFMSQWGEIEDINLVREKGTNKSLGYAFVKYEDQRSTILAVDNFNGIKLLGRVLRCDHVDRYRLPKEVLKREEELLEENPSHDVEIGPGHAYKHKKIPLQGDFTITQGIDLWAPPSSSSSLSRSSSARISKPLNDHGVAETKSDDERGNDSDEQRKTKKRKHKEEKHKSKKHKKDKKEYSHDKTYDEGDRGLVRQTNSNRSRSDSRDRRSYRDDDDDNDDKRRDRSNKEFHSNAVPLALSSMQGTVPAAATLKSYSTNVTASRMHQTPQALSWRGVHDPALLQQRAAVAPAAGGESVRPIKTTDTIDHRSFGGMNRLR